MSVVTNVESLSNDLSDMYKSPNQMSSLLQSKSMSTRGDRDAPIYNRSSLLDVALQHQSKPDDMPVLEGIVTDEMQQPVNLAPPSKREQSLRDSNQSWCVILLFVAHQTVFCVMFYYIIYYNIISKRV